MSVQPVARPHLDSLRPRPYRAASGIVPKYNLSANEACLGASPAAIAAAVTATQSLDRYPDGSALALRTAISNRYGLHLEHIICGAGSEELISLIVQAYAAPDDEVLFSQYGFIKYELAARAYGAVPVRAPETAFTADVDALLGAVTARTRIVFLANPNNPTGTYLPEGEVRRLRNGLRTDIVLVIDAAYAEFVEREDYSDGCALARETGNTLALRTFSKIHGLAGLRCGWGYGAPALIDTLHKVRGAFNVSTPAQFAAVAAIGDLAHERQAREHNTHWLAWLSAQLDAAGFDVIPSVCNFLVVRFRDELACQAGVNALATQGVLAMTLAGYGLAQSMRITIGTQAANHAVVTALTGKIS
jgi:histidinol-phosphate aminotransferase